MVVGDHRANRRRHRYWQRGGRGVVVRHDAGPYDQEQAQHDLHQPCPGGADRLFFRRMLVLDHEDEPAAAANWGREMRVRRADL